MKTRCADLAVFGSPPEFGEPLHVGRPNIGNRDRLHERFNRILDHRWLTNNGPFVRDFEARVADIAGVRHCVAMCNGTVALEIAIRALDMLGEVIVPSFTFVATVHALHWQAVTPVFCDVDPVTHSLDPDSVEALITPRTTGIIGVHVWGHACRVERLAEIARRRHLRLLFDAAHAFGCASGGTRIGNFGDAEVFSFHATKFVNTAEGGAVVTNNDALAEKIRLMRNFGFSGAYDQVDYAGTNGKMNEFSAALGLTSLESMADFVTACRRNYGIYRTELGGLPGLRMISHDSCETCNCQYVVFEVDEAEFGLTRDQLIAVLHAENVLARRYFYPGCHRMQPYCTLFPDAGLRLPVTERLCRRVIVLPSGTAVDKGAIERVCGVIRLAAKNADEIRRKLA